MSISLRRLLTLCLVATVTYFYSPRAAANGVGHAHIPAGELNASGRVLLDGSEAVNGVTFFSGSEIKTDEEASAVLALGALGRAELRPHSELRLGVGEGDVSASLGAGAVRLSKPEGVAAAVATASGSVVADRDGVAVFTVRYDAGRVTVETQSGSVRLRLGEKEVTVAAGERYSEAQAAQDDDEGLTDKQKAGIIAAIGGGVALLIIILAATGDDDEPVISPSR